jgi:hypothetical protein
MQSETTASVPAYDFMALLSDVGGALGLLLGATLLTVFEVTEFALHLIHDVIKMKKDCVVSDKKKREMVPGVIKVAEADSATGSSFP